VIATGVDWRNLQIEVRLNGHSVAKGRTKYMRTDVPELVSYISRYMTLLPGDVIYTGTVAPAVLPGERHEMQVGDVVEVEIENIGLLRNKIVPMLVP
jgi:2-keto-4-pentenoate hydratase/2-oxohepta-3-ene-1,7-dioic acid hydratase in catechol pathway